jgi:hypothetical protein
VTLDGLQDYHYFTELYSLTNKQRDNDVPTLFREVQGGKDFVELARTVAKDDRLASDITRDEERCFSSYQDSAKAIARKLTIAAELNKGFVAERRCGDGLNV